MYGIVLDRTTKRLTMVVEREWFQKTYPKSYRRHLEKELESANDADRQTLKRHSPPFAAMPFPKTTTPERIIHRETRKDQT